MTRRTIIWRVLAGAFILINALGAGYAFGMNEMLHGGVHVALLFAGLAGYGIWRMSSASRKQAQLAPADARVEYLQQSVDAIALEVERIGEAQRFAEKLKSELGEAIPPKKEQ